VGRARAPRAYRAATRLRHRRRRGPRPLVFTIFSVMGLILVPGMGTDYVIFFSEGKSHPRSTVLAITMSMLTTIFSFGLLGFTSLAGVFGLTVALGVLFSFLFTPILIGRQPHPHTILPGSR
ncbi:MAG: hypothetical protein P8107_12575, partial [Spirochaetia bacterium]